MPDLSPTYLHFVLQPGEGAVLGGLFYAQEEPTSQWRKGVQRQPQDLCLDSQMEVQSPCMQSFTFSTVTCLLVYLDVGPHSESAQKLFLAPCSGVALQGS